MTESNDTEGLTELDREALDHVQRLMSGSATLETLEAAKRWQNLSPAHADAIASARRLWTRLGPVAQEVLEQDGQLRSFERRRSARLYPSRRAWLGGAAAIGATAAGFAVIRPPFDLWPSLAELRADYRTATGEQRQVTLADGLSVTF